MQSQKSKQSNVKLFQKPGGKYVGAAKLMWILIFRTMVEQALPSH